MKEKIVAAAIIMAGIVAVLVIAMNHQYERLNPLPAVSVETSQQPQEMPFTRPVEKNAANSDKPFETETLPSSTEDEPPSAIKTPGVSQSQIDSLALRDPRYYVGQELNRPDETPGVPYYETDEWDYQTDTGGTVKIGFYSGFIVYIRQTDKDDNPVRDRIDTDWAQIQKVMKEGSDRANGFH